MPKRKSKIKISDKMIGIMIGIAITLSAIGIISALSVSSAHTNRNLYTNDMMDNGMMSMMRPMMMGDTMMDDNDMMNCMSMMMTHGEMTQEEIEAMLKSMDKDGDGLCDYCGMSVETCRKMMSS